MSDELQEIPTQDILLELQSTVSRLQTVVSATQQWSAGRIRSTDLLEVVGEYEKQQAEISS